MTRLLDESASRIHVLLAPPGYGKTTLARQWLDGRCHVWYQGASATADVAALASSLADGCAEIISGAGRKLHAQLQTTDSPDQDAHHLADLLAGDLLAWPEEAWLAIDDYQYAMASSAAESFIERLLMKAPIPAIISTRERPTWVTARHLLYGDVDVLSRASLAMDQAEVLQVLDSVGRQKASGLLALADGWPAVIGLAAHSPGSSVPDMIPDELYDFLAEELLNAFGRREQIALVKLAIPRTISWELASLLLGDLHRSIIARGEQSGLLNQSAIGRYSIHPLLRHFLLDRANSLDVDLQVIGDQLLTYFTNQRGWDDAFAVIRVTRLASSIPVLIRKALPELLATRRLTTLGNWLEFARGAGVSSPICDIALAELECRRGNPLQGQALAEHGAAALAPDDDFRPRALLLAGKAALLSNHPESAVRLYEAVRTTRCSESESYESAWWQFVAAARLESAEATELLDRLDAMSSGSPERELRRVSARMILAVRMGSLRGLSELFDAAEMLMSRVTDPFVRSSFLIAHAHLLALGGQYRRALIAADAALKDVREHHFEFAVPYGATVKSLSHLGLRQISQAAASIAEAEQLGDVRRDVYIQMNALALKARLLLHHGAAEQAVELLMRPWPSPPEKSMHAEYLATSALALACFGDRDGAIEQAQCADDLSQGVEAAVLATGARAIASEEAHTEQRTRELFELAERTGNYDGLVFASRLSPRLAASLSSDRRRRRALSMLVRDIGDYPLARRIQLGRPNEYAVEGLTPREQEVYELLALGLTNREIAGRLFISEATAKVHSLHIREKLGLRSRTEVALHASARGLQTEAALAVSDKDS